MQRVEESGEKRLSVWAWVGLAVILVHFMLVIIGDARYLLFFPLVLLPAWVSLALWYRHGRRHGLAQRKNHLGPIDSHIKLFTFVYFPGAVLVIIAELILTVVFVLVLFQREISDYVNRMKENQRDEPIPFDFQLNAKVFVFLFLNAFVVAGFCEEFLKLIVVNRCRTLGITRANFTQVIAFGFVGALGFSMTENIGYSTASRDKLGFGAVLGLILLRMLIATPLHTLTGILIGVSLSEEGLKRDRDSNSSYSLSFQTAAKILAIPILIHGLFDFQAFVFAAVGFKQKWPPIMCLGDASLCLSIGDIVSGLLQILILVLFGWYVSHRYRKIQRGEGFQVLTEGSMRQVQPINQSPV